MGTGRIRALISVDACINPPPRGSSAVRAVRPTGRSTGCSQPRDRRPSRSSYRRATRPPTIAGIVAGIRSELVELTGWSTSSSSWIPTRPTTPPSSPGRPARPCTRPGRCGPSLGSYPGKGEALWKAQFVTSGDVLVFIDADLTGWGTHFVTGLLGPLFSAPRTSRWSRASTTGCSTTARPVRSHRRAAASPSSSRARCSTCTGQRSRRSSSRWPVSGRSGGRCSSSCRSRSATASNSRCCWTWCRTLGLDAVAQVDLGARAHSHQSVHDLGVMAAEILAVAHRRLGLADQPAPGAVAVRSSGPATVARRGRSR